MGESEFPGELRLLNLPGPGVVEHLRGDLDEALVFVGTHRVPHSVEIVRRVLDELSGPENVEDLDLRLIRVRLSTQSVETGDLDSKPCR